MNPQPSARNAAQAFLLSLYAVARRAGLFETRLGRQGFDRVYGLYKQWVEGADVGSLRPLIAPGTVVIDVGANIGFFTLRFARWVSAGGQVVAIEPDTANLATLRRALQRTHLESVVDVIAAAATAESGEAFLEINPDHPGDHRLGTKGRAIKGVALDDLVAGFSETPVSLIKIDVQGAEAGVILGARKLLGRFRPALYIEIDDQNLRQFGSSAAELLDLLGDLGYTPRENRAPSYPPLNKRDILAKTAQSYIDVLFLKT